MAAMFLSPSLYRFNSVLGLTEHCIQFIVGVCGNPVVEREELFLLEGTTVREFYQGMKQKLVE